MGLRYRRARLIASSVRRRASFRERVAQLRESLTVHARFALHRWHAVCGEVSVNHYGTLKAAVYAAAQEAFARRLGEGIPVRSIQLSATSDDTVWIARFSPEVIA